MVKGNIAFIRFQNVTRYISKPWVNDALTLLFFGRTQLVAGKYSVLITAYPSVTPF